MCFITVLPKLHVLLEMETDCESKRPSIEVNSQAKLKILISDNTTVKQVGECKYLGALVNKLGFRDCEMKQNPQKYKVIDSLNSISWDKCISLKNEKYIVCTTQIRAILQETF